MITYPFFLVLVRISAAVQPVEEGFLANLNQSAAATAGNPGVYQLISTGSEIPMIC